MKTYSTVNVVGETTTVKDNKVQKGMIASYTVEAAFYKTKPKLCSYVKQHQKRQSQSDLIKHGFPENPTEAEFAD